MRCSLRSPMGSTGSGAFSMPRVGGVWERGRTRTRLAYLKMPARVEMNRLTVLPAKGSPVGVAGCPFRPGLSLPLATRTSRARSTSSSRSRISRSRGATRSSRACPAPRRLSRSCIRSTSRTIQQRPTSYWGGPPRPPAAGRHFGSPSPAQTPWPQRHWPWPCSTPRPLRRPGLWWART